MHNINLTTAEKEIFLKNSNLIFCPLCKGTYHHCRCPGNHVIWFMWTDFGYRAKENEDIYFIEYCEKALDFILNQQKIKFMYNGIKINGKLHKASYSRGNLVNHPDSTITIYGKNYKDLPTIESLQIENDSDSQSDYFCNDRIRVSIDNEYYNEINATYAKQEFKNHKRLEKNNKKHEIVSEEPKIKRSLSSLQTEIVIKLIKREKNIEAIKFIRKQKRLSVKTALKIKNEIQDAMNLLYIK